MIIQKHKPINLIRIKCSSLYLPYNVLHLRSSLDGKMAGEAADLLILLGKTSAFYKQPYLCKLQYLSSIVYPNVSSEQICLLFSIFKALNITLD